MSGPARLRDVAELAGVSPGLVSRLLNGDESLTVREETRDAVMRAVAELGYVANSAASSLRRSRTDTIGLALDHVTNPLFRELVRGAQQAATKRGSALLLLDVEDLTNDPHPFTALINARRIDGLLLQGGYSDDAVPASYSSQLPTVIVNSPGDGTAAGVSLQDSLAAEIATAHVLDLGHRNVAFIAGADGPATEARYLGFRTAFVERNLVESPDLYEAGGWDARDGFEATVRLLERGQRPTAYVVANAVSAMGTLRALAAAGIDVPGDASVVAVHDPWFAEMMTPPLTTVSLPLYELGRASVNVLLDQISGEAPQDLIIADPPPQLITRGSTGTVDMSVMSS